MKKQTNKRYCIVGRIPPPIGGVTVYVKRRIGQLVEGNVNVDFVCFSDWRAVLLVPFKRYSVIEVNSLNLIVILFFFLTFKISRCRFVDHNGSRNLNGIRKKLFKWLMIRSMGVLVVNEKLKSNYSESTNLKVVSPFIAPSLEDESEILSSYPSSFNDLFFKKEFFLNSAWKYIPYENTDLYGIRESLELLDCFENATMVLAIAEYNAEDIPNEVIALIAKHQKTGRLYLLTGQREIWPLFKKAKLSLRLTPTDGDSVSVKEALYFGCKVLASDAITRPTECLVYQYGNFEDLSMKFKELYT